MAGHSKWSKIKRQKGKTDAKRGAIFTKCAREIMVSVKEGGGPDPDANFRLRTAILKAKQNGVPNDNIERAIAKGSGGADQDNWESIQYEGYGPGGVAVMIEAMTDNRNRTAGDIRSYFTKGDGSLGATGCVGWMFNKKGVIQLDEVSDIDTLFLEAAEAGAEDIDEDDGTVEITTAPEDLQAVSETVSKIGDGNILSSEITFIPLNTVEVTDMSIAKKLLKMLDLMEEHEDIQKVHSNFEMSESILAEIGG